MPCVLHCVLHSQHIVYRVSSMHFLHSFAKTTSYILKSSHGRLDAGWAACRLTPGTVFCSAFDADLFEFDVRRSV